MAKRDLRAYLKDLDKEQLEEQILDLYSRFKQVKEFYDFVFNPKENKMAEEAKMRISNEYFPLKRKRPRKRRGIAQEHIRHFLQLGVDPSITADLMLYNIEVAQSYSKQNYIGAEGFYRSILNSFGQAMKYIRANGLTKEFMPRCEAISVQAEAQGWFNSDVFHMTLLVPDED
jgi:hypothetical protein